MAEFDKDWCMHLWGESISAPCLLNITSCAPDTTTFRARLSNRCLDCTRENESRAWEAALRSIRQLSDLRYLTLTVHWDDDSDDEEDNDAQEQPNWIGSLAALKKLEKLRLCDSRMDVLPRSSQYDYLTFLELQGCDAMTSLDGVADMPALAKFVLSGAAKLEALPQLGDAVLANLATLELVDCKSLVSLAALKNWGAMALTELYIEGAQLLGDVPPEADPLPELRSLPSIITLLLVDCGLSKFPSALGELTSLTELNLSQNATLLSREDNGCSAVDWPSLVNLKCINMTDCGGKELCWLSWLEQVPSLQLIELGFCKTRSESRTTMTISQQPLFLLHLPLLAAAEGNEFSSPWCFGRGLFITGQAEWSAQSMRSAIG
eukprot:COSAG02_NODE_14078_length_1313_cov_1.653213_1_plen_377_part_01